MGLAMSVHMWITDLGQKLFFARKMHCNMLQQLLKGALHVAGGDGRAGALVYQLIGQAKQCLVLLINEQMAAGICLLPNQTQNKIAGLRDPGI